MKGSPFLLYRLKSYSVLGIKRGATAAEVSAAFRKQMM
jgi:DnaJ-class molecular chaperone